MRTYAERYGIQLPINDEPDLAGDSDHWYEILRDRNMDAVRGRTGML